MSGSTRALAMWGRYRKQLEVTDELQVAYVEQMAEAERQQAESAAQIERYNQILDRMDVLIARQEAQFDAIDGLVDRWSRITDKYEQSE